MPPPRVTIDGLPEQTVLEAGNHVIVQDSGTTKKMLIDHLLEATPAPLQAHLDAVSDAHDASAVSAMPSGVGVDGPNVQAQLGQLAALVPTAQEVQIGPTAPTDAAIELWYDSDDAAGGITGFIAPYIDVRDYGAVGDGVADDAPAVRNAAAAAVGAGKAMYFPPGDYLFASIEPNQSICPITRGIRIYGEPGLSIIRIAPTLLGWRTVFGSIPWETHDMSGFTVEGLTFICSNLTDASNATSQRYAISAFHGSNMHVRHCRFVNWDGRNIIMFASNVVDTTKVVTDISVHHNVFTNIGGPYWHDHSALYLAARNIHVHNNDMTGTTTVASNAWTAMEVHGHAIHVHDNNVANYASPCLIVAANATTEVNIGPASNYHYHDNSAYNCGVGVTIRPVADMTDIDIHDNLWAIDIDQWPLAAAAPYPGSNARGGVLMYGQSTGLARVNIHHNACRWLPYTGTPSQYDAFVTWRRADRIAGADIDADVSITDNTIIDCPSAGVHVENFAQLVRWNVSRNTFVNVGKAALGAAQQAGWMIGYQSWTGARPIGVLNARFNDNQFVDDQATHTLSAALLSPAGTVRTDTGVGATTNGSTTVVDPNALVTDIGSLIAGTNIPAGAYITQITGSPDGYTGTGYTISAAATGDGTALTFTITKQPPTFTNVEALDTNKRIADGAAVPTISLQTGQLVTIRPRISIAYKTADQSVTDGTNLTDVAELGFPIEAGGIYTFEFNLFGITAIATTGIVVAINGPASPIYLRWAEISAVSGSAVNAGGQNVYNGVIANTAAVAVANGTPTLITGHVHNGPNAGTLQLRFRGEDAAAAVTIQRGSWGRLTRMDS